MYKIPKFKWDDRHKLFWMSDPHIFHNPTWPIPLWKSRGYASPDAAADDVRDKINARVGKDDTLFMLGDFFLNAKDEDCLAWLSQINCQNILTLFGNHESNMYRLYKQEVSKQYNIPDVEIYPLRMGNVVFMGNHLEILVGKKLIVMNHFPIHSWNSMNRNSWHLSAHQHLTDPTRRPDHPFGKCFDAGWEWKNDVWSFEEIQEVMETKIFVAVDHHEKTDSLQNARMSSSATTVPLGNEIYGPNPDIQG
jgi:calcineurin-like phosphoesterase family protein